jgi:hypothetical protein
MPGAPRDDIGFATLDRIARATLRPRKSTGDGSGEAWLFSNEQPHERHPLCERATTESEEKVLVILIGRSTDPYGRFLAVRLVWAISGASRSTTPDTIVPIELINLWLAA